MLLTGGFIMRMSQEQLSQLGKKLYSGLICDVLDYFGYRDQSFKRSSPSGRICPCLDTPFPSRRSVWTP